MPARAALFAFPVALAAAGCAAGVLPPSRSEVATTVIAGAGRPEHGVRFATGAHLASGQTARDARFDLGAGFIYERLAAPPPGSEARALGGEPMSAGDEPPATDARGSYLEVAGAIQRGPFHRTWIGARTELLRQESAAGKRAIGATVARLAWEAHAPVRAVGSSSGSDGTFGAGFAYGAVGLGLFVESGVRYAEGERPAFVALGGVSLRMPWLGGFVIDPTPRW